MRSRTILSLFTALALMTLAAPAIAGNYVAGGTFVVKTGHETLLDNGGVVCQGTDGDGIGGGCIAFPKTVQDPVSPEFPEGIFLSVYDADAGDAVAFQVCIDNNGDGICGGPQLDAKCFDQIFFSHSDGGVFHNPLGPLPGGFLDGCGGGFPGYVVLLCQGVHDDPRGEAHTHRLSAGTIQLQPVGTGYGDFCGGGSGGEPGQDGRNPAVAKAYTLI